MKSQVHYRAQNSQPLDPAFSQMTQVHILTSKFCKTILILYLNLHVRIPNGFFVYNLTTTIFTDPDHINFRNLITQHPIKTNLFNPLNTKRRLLCLNTQLYRAVNTFHLGYKNQSVYAVSGTSRCLFSDKYKTHKYSVGRT